MTTHLNRDKFFRKTTTGTLMLKRVSAEAEVQFPREYRAVFRDAANTNRAAAAALCKHLMHTKQMTLASSWARVQEMFNGPAK